ncbi:hypothetical protein V8073_004478 [Vibrio parahaemolyticus]|nr:hypothetical protein [Vibrio parahaemolyticus]EIT7131824.1 hypothetical protein [Vibrio parahaemolyticus]EIZ1368686.1 hypothetical protein [Vibrio parahaemolyticus]EIZ4252273.1 hypothetical protein [Vibrio parahaemolyticus]
MALWLAAIPLAYGAKKLYDALTEDDAPSSSSSSKSYDSNEKLKAAKKCRTSERRKAVEGLIMVHREKQRSDLQHTVKASGASVESSTPASYMIKHQNVGAQIQELTKVRRQFTDKNISSHKVAKTKVSLHSKASLVQKALGRAEKEYGELAGIDHLKNYDPKADPYLKHLKKNKRSILGFS